MKIMATSFKRSHAHTDTISAPDPAAGHCQPIPPLDTPGHSQAGLGQSLVGSLLLSLGSWCAQDFVYILQESVSPVLCKFWRLYVGLMLTSFQEGSCHTQVCCTQSPCPCSRPLLTHASTRDTQTQFWLSLCGVSASWCTQGFVRTLQESDSPVLCKFWWLYGGVKGSLSKRAYAIPRSAAPEPLPLRQATADLYLHRKHSNTQRQVWLSLCGVSWYAQGFA